MRQDIQKVIFERQRRGSSERSQKTRLKLNPCVDYVSDSDDFDLGPAHVSSARRRQEGHGVFHKSFNYSTRALTQFLHKAVGRRWDDIFSEICASVDNRNDVGHKVLGSLEWIVYRQVKVIDDIPYHLNNFSNGDLYEYNGFYIHEGILCEHIRKPYQRPKDPLTSIKWHGNVWFEFADLKRVAKCGCVHFKVPKPNHRYISYIAEPAVCIHGNEPLPNPIWYVVEYGYHDPDEVFMVYNYEDGEYTRFRFPELKNPGDKHYVYYRDVPEKLEEPITVSKKVANKKELKALRTLLNK